MTFIEKTKLQIESDEKNWLIPFIDFVDEFRRKKDIGLVQKPFKLSNKKIDAILASTIEYLCDELKLQTPKWVWKVPGCDTPWFVSGIENLKAISIVESPVFFRRRQIFVLANFLDRV